ncbi:MAG: 50S ribosomal protein L25 [Myxococcota bacterium]
MNLSEIEVSRRDQMGKGPARRLRARGQVPAVVYGHKEAPVALELDPKNFLKHLRTSGMGRNTLFKLKGLDREPTCLVKDMQFDPVRRDLRHVDLHEVRESDRVLVDIPVRLTGRAVGVIAGGDLSLAKRTLTVRCSPMNIPKQVVLDVSPMGLGATIRVGDVALPENVESVENPRLAVVTVKESRRSRQIAATEGGEPKK